MNDRVYVYHTSPNQKTVITKKTRSDKENTYGIFNVEATLTASKALSDRAFKLYVRMNLHQDGHTYALSPVEINHSSGLSDKRYREAVNEMISKGYLVESEKKAVYYFYESPPPKAKEDALAEDVNESSVHIGKMTRPHREYDQAISDRSFGDYGQMTRPFRQGNPAISGGEIIHNITSNNTNDITSYNTDDNTCIDEEIAWKEYVKENSDFSSHDLDDGDLPF